MLPDVPTVAEAGLPGYEAANWFGIVAPAGTPPADHRQAAQGDLGDPELPEVQKQFANEGAEIVRMSPAEFGALHRAETAKWGRVVKEAGIKAE